MTDFAIDGKKFYTFLNSLARNKEVSNIRFKGYGISMTPFIRNGNTLTIKIINKNDFIKTGDIVAVKQNDKKKIIIHRVIELKNEYYHIKGDNKIRPDGWFPRGSIIGIITEIKRNSGKKVDFKRWHNFIIAFFSKTGLLNFLLLPLGRWLKKSILKSIKK